MALARPIIYFDKPVVFVCDAQCGKAWGIQCRPRVQLSDDPEAVDDFAYLADGELGDAPTDPGTYEGGDAKPTAPEERGNRWCVRQCERGRITPYDAPPNTLVESPDLSRRLYNCPASEPVSQDE